MKVHFYRHTEFPIRYWHPVDLVAWLLFVTVWRGEPSHCNVEIDDSFYDFGAHSGTRIVDGYPAKPMRTIDIEQDDKDLGIFMAKSLQSHNQRRLPMILDVLGIWPKSKKRQLSCVTLTCIIIGRAFACRRPGQLLKSLENEHLRIPKNQAHGNA